MAAKPFCDVFVVGRCVDADACIGYQPVGGQKVKISRTFWVLLMLIKNVPCTFSKTGDFQSLAQQKTPCQRHFRVCGKG